ncbi:conserved hypothetical protein [Ricinus communis]|uniref:Uncharacterized protein n=1 Tax=Ricinus communis TaxID=3988 RepID=B9S7G8_RICCO|nr:conserved hypothetical protein [Ricinus communis]
MKPDSGHVKLNGQPSTTVLSLPESKHDPSDEGNIQDGRELGKIKTLLLCQVKISIFLKWIQGLKL